MTRGHRKTAVGIVTSDKMDKTITVESERRVLHPRFKKYIKARTRYKAHDERNEAREGDQVLISETRPLSKTKRWRLLEVIRKAQGADVDADLAAANAQAADGPDSGAQGAETP